MAEDHSSVGARQKVSDYKEEWAVSIEAGAGVEKNEMSDLHYSEIPPEE